MASVSNQAPEVWIELKQDKTIIIHAPQGVTIETDETVTVNAQKLEVNAPQQVDLNTPLVNVAGRILQAGSMGSGGPSEFHGGLSNTGGQVTSNGVTLETHTHTGVEPGSGNTGRPQ